MGKVYYWDPVEKVWSDAPRLAAPSGPAVISDAAEPFRSHADGKTYDSKSAYRRELRARGYVELGNDRPNPHRHREEMPSVEASVIRAFEERG